MALRKKSNNSLKKKAGQSIKNSFYLQRTTEIPGRYKPYYEYIVKTIDYLEATPKEKPITRTLSKNK